MQNRGLILTVLVLLAFISLAPLLLRAAPSGGGTKRYSELVHDVANDKVDRVTIAGRQLTVVYKDATQFQVTGPRRSDLPAVLDQAGVNYSYQRPAERSIWTGLLTSILPVALMVGWLVLMMGNSGGAGNQLLQFSRSRARMGIDESRRVTMNDVAGMAEVKEEMAEVVDFLRSPERYQAIGARIPKGIMLSGPPGTGKTLLARAVAGEASVPFFSASGSEFVEMFAGVGASRVRDLFERARQSVPCIVFVDEIDAVGRSRSAGIGGTNDEREQTLNQLLVEMDGFAPNEGIIVMAATNRMDVLDRAILRPGRFDRQIHLDLPDRRGREEILRVHARGKSLSEAVDLSAIARQTVGFTGADLANLLNEAALLAARRRLKEIGPSELYDAFDRIVSKGPAHRRQLGADERRRLAYHEAGHAVVALNLPEPEDQVTKVSIIGRGQAAAYVMYQPKDDKYLHTNSEFQSHIARLLAGRAAEELGMGDISTGASSDLERATSLARTMVTELGMSAELGPVRLAGDEMPRVAMGLIERNVSNRTSVAVDEAVKRLIMDGYALARDLLERHRQALDRLAHALLERETLEGAEVYAIVGVPAPA